MAEEMNYTTGVVYPINLPFIEPDPNQPRKHFDEDSMAELVSSIQKVGVLSPILVRMVSETRFIIVAGERRYQAALAAGMTGIPAMIVEGDPLEISIIENLQRESLTAIEEAEALANLKSTKGYQLNELAKVLGKSEPTLCQLLSLNKLPDSIKDDCRKDPKASRGILAEIAKQKSPEKMADLYRRYKSSGLTRGEIRAATVKTKKKEILVDLAFIAKCAKQLDGVELQELDQAQTQSMSIDLETLRLAIDSKLRQLVAPAAQE